MWQKGFYLGITVLSEVLDCLSDFRVDEDLHKDAVKNKTAFKAQSRADSPWLANIVLRNYLEWNLPLHEVLEHITDQIVVCIRFLNLAFHILGIIKEKSGI
jgi:hypothetical protein